MRKLALGVSAACIAPVIAFAVLWSGILMALFVTWLWYTGTLVPISFLVLGFGSYLLHRHHSPRYIPLHA